MDRLKVFHKALEEMKEKLVDVETEADSIYYSIHNVLSTTAEHSKPVCMEIDLARGDISAVIDLIKDTLAPSVVATLRRANTTLFNVQLRLQKFSDIRAGVK